MVKFLIADETLPLRSMVLRDGAPLNDCHFQGDDAPGTFHMGYQSPDGAVVSILTCQSEPMEGYDGIGYRLRGMATHPDWRGKGVGSHLLLSAIEHLSTVVTADYLWCNARRVAYDFYLHLGFDFVSGEFDIPNIGPHRVMYLMIDH